MALMGHHTTALPTLLMMTAESMLSKHSVDLMKLYFSPLSQTVFAFRDSVLKIQEVRHFL